MYTEGKGTMTIKRTSTEASTAASAVEALAAHANCNCIRVVSDIPKSQIMHSLGVVNDQVQEVTIHDTRVIITNDEHDEYGANLPTYEVRKDALDSDKYVFLMSQNARLSITTVLSAIISLTLIYYGYYHPETSADMFMNFMCGVAGLLVFTPATVYGATLLARRSRIARLMRAHSVRVVACSSMQRVSM